MNPPSHSVDPGGLSPVAGGLGSTSTMGSRLTALDRRVAVAGEASR